MPPEPIYNATISIRITLTHFGPVTTYDDIDLASIDLPSIKHSDIRLREISQEIP